MLGSCSSDLLTAVQGSAPTDGHLPSAPNLTTLGTNALDSWNSETNALKIHVRGPQFFAKIMKYCLISRFFAERSKN